jgi:hypothetical protein
MRVRNSLVLAGAVLLACGTSAQAQCATSGTTADACRKTTDLFNFLTPQISTALVGGSTTLGQGGVLGGFPHFALAVRASAVNGTFPTLNNVGFNTNSAQRSDYQGEDQFIPMASIDGAVGLYKGFPLGVTRVGGVDVLMTATYIPTAPEGGDVTVSLPGGSTKFGYGLRVGLLQESILVPGVSFSWVQRALPTISVAGQSTVAGGGTTAPGEFSMNDLDIKTSSWRFSASKTFLVFGLQAGVGQDKYDNSANLRVTVRPQAPLPAQTTNVDVSNGMTRTNI